MSVRKRQWVTGKGERREGWVVDYADATGSRHLKTFAKKKDADAYHDAVRVDVRKGLHTAPSKSPTVSEAAELWIARVEAGGAERTTIRQYRQHATLHINPRIGAIKIANLTPGHVEAFRDQLLQDLSRALARKVLTSLRSILKASKASHVAADVSIAKSKRAERKLEIGRDILAPGEIKRMVEAATASRIKALVLTAALTGLRASELRGLRWRDVDLKASELHVRQRADRFNVIGAPKSSSSARTIPLGPAVTGSLKTWKLACPKGDLDLVFPSGKDAVVMHHKNMARQFETLMKAAKLTDKDGNSRYSLHSLRHYFASWCINPRDRGGRGLTAKVVQELMGHSTITLTMDRYGHLFPRGDDRVELAAAEQALLMP